MSGLRHGDSDCRANRRLQLPQPSQVCPALFRMSKPPESHEPSPGWSLVSPGGGCAHTHWSDTLELITVMRVERGLSLMGAQIDQGNTLGKRSDTEKNLKKHRVTFETWRGNTTVREREGVSGVWKNTDLFIHPEKIRIIRKAFFPARPLKRVKQQPQAGISNVS